MPLKPMLHSFEQAAPINTAARHRPGTRDPATPQPARCCPIVGRTGTGCLGRRLPDAVVVHTEDQGQIGPSLVFTGPGARQAPRHDSHTAPRSPVLRSPASRRTAPAETAVLAAGTASSASRRPAALAAAGRLHRQGAGRRLRRAGRIQRRGALLWRAGFIALALFGPGIVIYSLLWVVIPPDPGGPDDSGGSGFLQRLRKGLTPKHTAS